ncbi:uncharacterized protein LOC126901648 isoform X2 [Daktulosphaira vitifoliae]|uniref:uncharacterized protein LOC126901648 isoform X2 n=1 Tax=Daktulosphaira vitifoliae TaxID=58002 RepID=UPI0021AB04DC|nr:uncharacterized protein LOC126901648 isoform X2 [Daktulosphaira vitifoliae]
MKIFFANIILLVVLQQTRSVSDLPENTAESTVSDLPENTAESAVSDLPENTAESAVSDLPENTAESTMSDGPKSIPEKSISKCYECGFFNGCYKFSPDSTDFYCEKCYDKLKFIYYRHHPKSWMPIGSNKANIPY